MTWQPVRSQKVFRTKLAGEAQRDPPKIISHLVSIYAGECVKNNWPYVRFSMDGLPMSVNNMYDRVGYKKKTGGNGVITKRTKEVDDFRLNLMQAMGNERFKWKPTGVTAAIIMLESPHWLTQKRQVAQMDADNRVKVLLDAIENATDSPDELYWTNHVFKVCSKRVRTTVWLFDLGDVIEYYF